MSSLEDEWLWGWDPTPGIVSVWAEDNLATIWRRIDDRIVREELRFRPWLLLDRIDHLETSDRLSARELDGVGALRYLVRADDAATLIQAVLQGASRRLGRRVSHLREQIQTLRSYRPGNPPCRNPQGTLQNDESAPALWVFASLRFRSDLLRADLT